MDIVAARARSWSVTIVVAILGMAMSAVIVTAFIATRPSPCCGHEVPVATIYHEPLSRMEVVLTAGDGHAFTVIARDPLLQRPGVLHGASELAYRAQRPVWAYLTWAGSLGQPGLTPWALAVLAVLAAGGACGVAAMLLQQRGCSGWWALAVPLIGLETLTELTPELFAVSLLGAGVLLWQRHRHRTAVLLMIVAALTRETLLVGIAAFALWALVHCTGDLRRRIARTWILVIPFLVYVVWIAVLRVHLGAWPFHRSNDRLSLMPGAGLLQGVEHASSATTIVLWAAVGLLLAVATLLWARRDPLTWIAVAFAAFGALMGPEVWSPSAGYQRTLLPLFYFAPIALLGALRRRQSLLKLRRIEESLPNAASLNSAAVTVASPN